MTKKVLCLSGAVLVLGPLVTRLSPLKAGANVEPQNYHAIGTGILNPLCYALHESAFLGDDGSFSMMLPIGIVSLNPPPFRIVAPKGLTPRERKNSHHEIRKLIQVIGSVSAVMYIFITARKA